MRILYVIGSLDVGGTEGHLAAMLPELRRRGWDVEVLCLLAEGSLAARLQSQGVPVRTLRVFGSAPRAIRPRPLRALLALVACIRFLRRNHPDVIHFFLPEAYFIGGLAAMVAGVNVRIMSRRSLNRYQARYPWLARAERRLHSRMAAVVANSGAVMADLAEEGVPSSKRRLIYNGVDLRPFDAVRERGDMRRTLGIPDDMLVLVIVANLIEYKGHADLIQALAAVDGRMPDWRLLCVGRDEGRGAKLKRLASELGIGDRIVWTGVRDDVPDILAASDVSVLCSHEEGFSNAILESMASGLPLVVTDVGGNAEAVIDGVTGRVVPARDPEALGEAILALSTSPDRGEIGSRARKRVEEHFSIEACADAYESLYRDVLSPSGKQST